MVCQPDLAHGPSLADFFTSGPSNVAQDWPVQYMNCSGSLCPAALFSKCCRVLCGHAVGGKVIGILFIFSHVTDNTRCQGNTSWRLGEIDHYCLTIDMSMICTRDIFYASPVMEGRSRGTGTSIWGHLTCCGQRLWVACYRKIKQLTQVQSSYFTCNSYMLL